MLARFLSLSVVRELCDQLIKFISSEFAFINVLTKSLFLKSLTCGETLEVNMGAGEGVVDGLEPGAVLMVPAVAVAPDPLGGRSRFPGRRVVKSANGAHPSFRSSHVVDT